MVDAANLERNLYLVTQILETGVAVMIADRLLADPRLADQVAAARRELAQP